MQNGLYNILVKDHNSPPNTEGIDAKLYQQFLRQIIRIFDTDINAQIPLAYLISMSDITVVKLSEREKLSAADLRVRDLTLRNFRKFPHLDNNTLWGIAGTRKNADEVCSLFLVGENGTGKTSLYSALEYLFTGRISAMEERMIPDSDNNYMVYGFGKEQDNKADNVYIAMNCMDNGEYTREKPLQLPAVNFCSDYEMRKFSENGDNLNSYILDFMGYKEIESLIMNLKRMEQEGKVASQNEKRIVLGRREIMKCINAMISFYDKKDTTFCNEQTLEKTIGELTAKLDKLRAISSEKISNELEQLKTADPVEFFLEEDKEIIRLIGLYNEIREYIKTTAETAPPVQDVFDQFLATTLTAELLSDKNFPDRIYLRNLYSNLQKNVPRAVEELFIGIEIIRLMRQYLEPNEGITLDCISRIIKEKESIMLYDSPMRNMSEMRKKYNDIIPCIKKLKATLEEKRNRLIDLFYNTSRQTISEVMKHFSEKNENFSLNINKERHTVTFSIEVATENGSFATTPKQYFNTFRYKLFVIALKTTLTFTYMLEHRCLLPIVIDDVFNASDFNNGQLIEFFISRIYTLYQIKLKELHKGRQLQIILLTHDELMVHSFKKGYSHFAWLFRKQSLPFNVICGRLFNYEAILKNKSFIRKTYRDSFFHNLYMEVLEP